MRYLPLLCVLLVAGCDAPVDPDDRWLIVEASGSYVGTVTFDNGHKMDSSGEGDSIFPLYAGETVCWSFQRADAEPGYLRVFVSDRAGRRKERATSTTAPYGQVEGCV